MRQSLLAPVVSASLGLLLFAWHPLASTAALPLFSSILATQTNGFESLAQALSKKGVKACAPASLIGKSGVKHEFAFAITPDAEKAKVVVDTELSVDEVDEMKVLKFFVKVFDVAPERAILCVSPKLNERAAVLAREYKILVCENDVPKKLVGQAEDAVEVILADGAS